MIARNGIVIFAALVLALAGREAAAVLIQTADDTGNTTAPADDPGFAKVEAQDFWERSYWGAGPDDYNAVFGNLTCMADRSYYQPQIVAAVPEPSTAVLAACAAAGLLIIRPRRKAP